VAALATAFKDALAGDVVGCWSAARPGVRKTALVQELRPTVGVMRVMLSFEIKRLPNTVD
jgi:hypothetical protein